MLSVLRYFPFHVASYIYKHIFKNLRLLCNTVTHCKMSMAIQKIKIKFLLTQVCCLYYICFPNKALLLKQCMEVGPSTLVFNMESVFAVWARGLWHFLLQDVTRENAFVNVSEYGHKPSSNALNCVFKSLLTIADQY